MGAFRFLLSIKMLLRPGVLAKKKPWPAAKAPVE
jgi:hypothetical protein